MQQHAHIFDVGLKFDVWLGHLPFPSLSWRISKRGSCNRDWCQLLAPRCPRQRAPWRGELPAGWGTDPSRTPLTSEWARTYVQEMCCPGNRQYQRETNPQKKSNLNTAVRLTSWKRVVDNASKWKAVLPQSVCIPLTCGPDDALLLQHPQALLFHLGGGANLTVLRAGYRPK